MAQEGNIDLSFATLDELIEELKKRSNALVVGIELAAESGVFRAELEGSRLRCCGLLRALTLENDKDLIDARRDYRRHKKGNGE
jgi:hypothetical protein